MNKIRIIGSLVAASLISTSAFAASGSSSDWSGMYLGGSLGKGDGQSDGTVALGGDWVVEGDDFMSVVAAQSAARIEPDGSAYAAHFGYNFQSGNWVFGGEIEVGEADMDGTRSRTGLLDAPYDILSLNLNHSIETGAMSHIRGRAGYAFGNSHIYLSVGSMRLEVDALETIAFPEVDFARTGTVSETLSGTSFGAGYEYKFSERWSARFDYSKADLGDYTVVTQADAGTSFTTYDTSYTYDMDFSMIRVGVSYHF